MQPTTFVTRLNNVVANLDRDTVKAAIGDSVTNNRTLTVGQVVRFLTTRRRRNLRQLGNHLESVRNAISFRAQSARIDRGSNRTDAIDIYEFIDAVVEVANDPAGYNYSFGLFQTALKRA